MNGFYIESLAVSGPDKQTSSYEFLDGLNIIRGYSNSGKTWMLNCINYMFGSDKIPFSEDTGYKYVQLIVNSREYGRIKLERQLREKTVSITSSSSEIQNGSYYTKNGKKVNALFLNDFWLKLIGIDKPILIPKNENFERQILSWRSIEKIFTLDEKEVPNPGSIILTDNAVESTALISSLIYFLTGNNFEKNLPVEQAKIKKAKKTAMIDMLNEQLATASAELVKIEEIIKDNSKNNIEIMVQDLSEKILAAKEDLAMVSDKYNSVLNEIADAEMNITENNLLLNRYKVLESQYTSDIQRLKLIYEGQKATESISNNDTCPFCGAPITSHKIEMHSDAITAELNRIIAELKALTETERCLQVEIDEQTANDGSLEPPNPARQSHCSGF